MSALGSLVVKLALEYAEYTQGLNKSDQASLQFAQNAQRNFDQASAAAQEFVTGLLAGAAGAAAAYLSFGAVINGVSESIERLAKLDDSAQKTGSSIIESLSRLQKTAMMTGADFGVIDKAVFNLAKTMGATGEEANKMRGALAALGLSKAELDKTDTAGNFIQISKALQGYADGQGKSVAMNVLFKKSAEELLPVMNDVAENVDKFTGRTAAAAQAASAFQDNLGEMRVRTAEVYDILADEIVPVLATFTGEMVKGGGVVKTVTAYLKELAASGKIREWAETAADGVRFLMSVIVPAAKIVAAYFAIFVAAPAILSVVSAATWVLVSAVATHTMNVLIGQTATLAWNQSLFGTSVAAELAAGSLSKMRLAGSVLFAAFTGWQIGTYLSEQFLEARLAGLALVGGLLVAWENISFNAKLHFEAIKLAWEKTVNAMGTVFATHLSAMSAGFSLLGMKDTGDELAKYADGLRNAGAATKTFAEMKASLTAEHKKSVDAIEADIGGQMDYEAATDKANKALKAQAKAEEETKKPVNYAGGGKNAAYDAAIKRSEDFIAQIKKETMEIGMTTEQKKVYEGEQIASAMRVAHVQETVIQKFLSQSAVAAAALEKRKDAFKAAADLEKIRAGMANDLVAALDREALADHNAALTAKTYAESLQQSNDYLALETSLLGASDVQRQITLANKQIDLELDRQILAIKKELGSTEAQNAAIEAANQAARGAKVATATNIVANDNYQYIQKAAEDARNSWKKTGDDIQRTLTGAFGRGGEAIGKMAGIYGGFVTAQLNAEKKLADIKKSGDADRIIKAETEARKESIDQQIGMYGDMAGAAKSYFDEQSTAYKILDGIEKAMFAFKFAAQMKDLYTSLFVSSAKASGAVAGQTVETGAVVAGEAARNVAKVPGVFMSFMSALGPWGAAAAAIAVAAVLGSAMGVGGGGTSFMSAKERQAKQGAGSVFGGAEDDKSSSLSKSLDMLRSNSDIALPMTSRMLFLLNSIDGNIGGMVNAIVRSTGLRGGAQDTLGMGLGSSKGAFGFSSESKELVDQGIAVGTYGTVKVPHTRQVRNYTGAEGGEGESTEEIYYTEETKFKPQTIGQVRAAGSVDGSKYSMTHSEESSWWGLSQSSSDETIYKELDKSIKRQMGLTVISIAEGVEEGAVALGASREEVRKEIDAYNVEIGLISLKGLSGAELQDELNAVFSKFGDGLAASVMPGLDDFEKVGEGYLQTLIRVASGVESAQYSLEKLGIKAIDYTQIVNKQGDVTTEMLRQSIAGYETVGGTLSGIGDIIDTFTGTADELIQTYGQLTDTRNMLDDVGAKSTDVTREMIRSAGGLDRLQAGIKSYYDAYFSEDEKRANSLQRLGAEFGKLQDPVTGLALTMPTSMAGFRTMAEGIDTSTTAGQELYAKLMLLSEGFGDVQGAIEAERAERMKSFDGNFLTDKQQENKAKDTAMQDLDATFATLGQAVPQTHQQFVDLFNSFNDANDPMHKTRDALLKVSDSFVTVHGSAQDAADAIDSIKELMSGVHDAAQNSIFNMQYDVADNEGKYKLLDAKGAGYEKEMRGTDDINQIADFAQKQIAVLDQAWGLLDDEQKRAMQAQFEAKYNDIDKYVKEKGADAIGLQKANNAELAGMIGKEVAAALFGTGIATALEQAAAGIASTAEIDPSQEAAALVAKGGGQTFEEWKESAAGSALVDPADGMLGMGAAIGSELAESFNAAMQAMISGPLPKPEPRIEVDPASGKSGMSASESKAYAAKVAESAESNKVSAEGMVKAAKELLAAAESMRLAAATPIKSELSVNVTAVAGVEVAIA